MQLATGLKKLLEKANAHKVGVQGKTSQRTDINLEEAFMEILIGGEYKRKNNEVATYGHAALRVVVDKADTTYDFGRYGKTWGPFESQGEGILQVWHSFEAYINGENAYGRQTIGFVYSLDHEEAQKIRIYFGNLAQLASVRETNRARTVYQLEQDYNPTLYNCTTITIEGARQSGKNIMENTENHAQQRGLTVSEKLAAMSQAKPDHGIFMPADLQSVLEANTACPYVKRNTYGSKR